MFWNEWEIKPAYIFWYLEEEEIIQLEKLGWSHNYLPYAKGYLWEGYFELGFEG